MELVNYVLVVCTSSCLKNNSVRVAPILPLLYMEPMLKIITFLQKGEWYKKW
jgi:hypothetical protein